MWRDHQWRKHHDPQNGKCASPAEREDGLVIRARTVPSVGRARTNRPSSSAPPLSRTPAPARIRTHFVPRFPSRRTRACCGGVRHCQSAAPCFRDSWSDRSVDRVVVNAVRAFAFVLTWLPLLIAASTIVITSTLVATHPCALGRRKSGAWFRARAETCAAGSPSALCARAPVPADRPRSSQPTPWLTEARALSLESDGRPRSALVTPQREPSTR